MALLKNISLGGLMRILSGGALVAIIVAMLTMAGCSSLPGLGRASNTGGIPTPPPGPAPAAQAAAPNPPPAAPAVSNTQSSPVIVQPAPAQPVAPNPAPAAVPTVQPIIIGDSGDVRVPTNGQPAQPGAVVQPDTGISAAPVIDGTQSDAACGQRINHTVAAGENLFRIAYRYRTTTYSVARLNGISNTRKLSVGRTLVVVTCDRAGGWTGSNGGAGRRYVVRAGDNLFRIGVRYGTTAEHIRAANNLPSFTISVGQVLIIP